MRWIVRGLLAFGLIPASIACSDDRTASAWIPTCHRLPAEEAEHIISMGGEHRPEGDVEGAIAVRGRDSHQGRAVWGVVLQVGGTQLVLLHDTAESVQAPGEAGWRDGRWVSHDPLTRHVLRLPLNERVDEPYPDEVVQDALRCELTEFPF